jgi:hypothetical protein
MYPSINFPYVHSSKLRISNTVIVYAEEGPSPLSAAILQQVKDTYFKRIE